MQQLFAASLTCKKPLPIAMETELLKLLEHTLDLEETRSNIRLVLNLLDLLIYYKEFARYALNAAFMILPHLMHELTVERGSISLTGAISSAILWNGTNLFVIGSRRWSAMGSNQSINWTGCILLTL